MKSFKQIMSEVAEPKSGDEKRFKDKHVIDKVDHPVALDHQFTGKVDGIGKAARIADHEKGEDEKVYEAKMDPVGQADDDIDNDGDVDSSDKYLHNRRKAIKKALAKKKDSTTKEEVEVQTSDAKIDEISMDKAISTYAARKSQAQGAAHQGSRDYAKKQMAKARKTKAYIDKRESIEEAVDLEMHKKAAANHAAKAKPVGNKWPKGAEHHDNAAKAHQHVINMHKKFGPDHSGTKNAVAVAKNASNRAAGDSYKTALKKSGMKEEVKELDEISKTKMGQYIKRAHGDKETQKKRAGIFDKKGMDADKDKDMYNAFNKADRARKKAGNRTKFIGKAVDRITKEAVEEVDEAAIPKRRNGRTGAPKMTGDSVAIQRAKDAEHNKAMGRTKTGRKKSVRTMTSTQRSLASLRNEQVEQLDELDSKTQKKFVDGAKAMKAYAQKNGGVDKADFMKIAKSLETISKINLLQAGQELARLNRLVDGMDTDVRERVHVELKKVGLVESVEETVELDETYEQLVAEAYEFTESAWEEVPMMKRQLYFMAYAAEEIMEWLGSGVDPEEWFQNKMAVVHGSMRTLYGYVQGEKQMMDAEVDMFEETKLKETTLSAVKRPVNQTGPDGKTRTVYRTIKKTDHDQYGQDKIKHNEEAELEESFKAGILKLKDGSSVIVKKQDADLLNKMMKDLRPNNRKSMTKTALIDKAGFEEILGFAREAL